MTREEKIEHHLKIQMQKDEERAKREAEKAKVDEKTKEYIKNYAKLLAEPKNDGSDEWFMRNLNQRTAAKARTKITHHADKVDHFLTLAYQRRVECDNRVFIDDNITKTMISGISPWLTQSRYNGLLMRGSCGVGKSTMMRAIMDVFYICEGLCTREVTANDAVNMSVNDPKGFKDLCECSMLAIDDLGTEAPTIKSYGNELSPMVELLTQRHRQLRFTIITTNLIVDNEGVDQLSERYGKRILDRLTELCAFVSYNGEQTSYRQIR